MAVTGGIVTLVDQREVACSSSCWSPGEPVMCVEGSSWSRKYCQSILSKSMLSVSQSVPKAGGSLVGLMVSDTTLLLTHSYCAPVFPWGHSRQQWDPIAAQEETAGSSSSCPLQLWRPCVSALQKEYKAEAPKIEITCLEAARSRKRPRVQTAFGRPGSPPAGLPKGHKTRINTKNRKSICCLCLLRVPMISGPTSALTFSTFTFILPAHPWSPLGNMCFHV